MPHPISGTLSTWTHHPVCLVFQTIIYMFIKELQEVIIIKIVGSWYMPPHWMHLTSARLNPFSLRTALILCDINSTRCWKHWSILTWKHHTLPAVLSPAHPWCESPLSSNPKSALLDWDLVTMEVTWIQLTNFHVQETSLRWSELFDMVLYPGRSSHWKMDTLPS